VSPTLVATRGLPASGKSTWARELLGREPGRWKRVNKDDLRDMLDGGKWSKKNEKLVVEVRDTLVSAFLARGLNVVVDDTNLEGTHLRDLENLAAAAQADFRVEDFTHVPVETCVERDLLRARSVGKDVIVGMYRRALMERRDPPRPDPALPDAVLCDLDGTLALMHDRSPYREDLCFDDALNLPVYSYLRRAWAAGHEVVLLSGRDEGRGRAETERWLEHHKVPFKALHMRRAGDTRKDSVVKRELYEAHVEGRYNVEVVLDDRDQVVELWRSLGLPCWQVAYGNF
jgi:predicted kinase